MNDKDNINSNSDNFTNDSFDRRSKNKPKQKQKSNDEKLNMKNTQKEDERYFKKDSQKRTHTPVEGYKMEELRMVELPNLIEIALKLGIQNPQEYLRQELIFEILKMQVSQGGYILISGILEIVNDGYGFLRSIDEKFSDTQHDTYVSQSQIQRFALRNGDIITGQVRAPKDQERYYALLQIEAINYLSLKEIKNRPLFENLTPLFPTQQLKLEYDKMKITGRMLDLFSPIGKGQRALIVAPPRTGKTELMKELAHGISHNHPEVELMVLLIDERPEEVTDMERSVKGQVFSSTFDLPSTNHIRVAELVLERAKRRIEVGKDVVILLDSITRLARAYNAATPSSGKVLSGGVDANALHKPKRFFGAARNIEHGGSLTIIATALVETGSRMDEVIFEEFKGTGNAEIVLSRSISDRRIYPAFDILRSGTRKDNLLLGNERLSKVWILRNAISQMDDTESLTFLYSKMKNTTDNDDFLSAMNIVS